MPLMPIVFFWFKAVNAAFFFWFNAVDAAIVPVQRRLAPLLLQLNAGNTAFFRFKATKFAIFPVKRR